MQLLDQCCGRTLEEDLANLNENFVYKACGCLLRIWEGSLDVVRPGLLLEENTICESCHRGPVRFCWILVDVFYYCDLNFWALAWRRRDSNGIRWDRDHVGATCLVNRRSVSCNRRCLQN